MRAAILVAVALVLLLASNGLARAADAALVLKVLVCESGLRHDAVGDNGKSRGIAQFRKETFYEFAAMARKELRAANIHKPNWHNPQHQVFLLAWGLDNGYGNRWTCYRTLTAKLDVALLPKLASPPPGPDKTKLFGKLPDF